MNATFRTKNPVTFWFTLTFRALYEIWMVAFWFVCSDCFNYTLGAAEVVYGHS